MKDFNGKITRDFLLHNDVVFIPENVDESEQLQRLLFEHGVKWANGATHPIELVNSLQGLHIHDGLMRYRLNDEIEKLSVKCTYKQLLASSSQPKVVEAPPEEVVTKSYMQNLFNHLSRQIELQNKIIEKQEKLIEELYNIQTGGGREFKRIKKGQGNDRSS